MDILGASKSDLKDGIKHPVALFIFGMLFAAFLFPMIAKQLGVLKAKGGTLSKIIPAKFTTTTAA
jgi:hypothetical protein